MENQNTQVPEATIAQPSMEPIMSFNTEATNIFEAFNLDTQDHERINAMMKDITDGKLPQLGVMQGNRVNLNVPSVLKYLQEQARSIPEFILTVYIYGNITGQIMKDNYYQSMLASMKVVEEVMAGAAATAENDGEKVSE